MAKRSVLVMLFALQLLYPFMGCFDQLYDPFRYTGKTPPHGYEMNLAWWVTVLSAIDTST